jgi:ElaB/YqjD/DUF883 family membrane-anchored ribosome-binding protein
MKTTTPAVTSLSAGDDRASAAVNNAAASLHGVLDKAAGAADDAVRKATPAIDRVADAAHQTVDRAARAALPTAAWLNEQGNSLRAVQRTVAADAGEYVSAHPWKSIGLALAAGFLIGRIAR